MINKLTNPDDHCYGAQAVQGLVVCKLNGGREEVVASTFCNVSMSARKPGKERQNTYECGKLYFILDGPIELAKKHSTIYVRAN